MHEQPVHGRGKPSARWTWPAALLAGFVVQLVVRVWMLAASSEPSINPDEIGYLSAARLIAGGARTGLDFTNITMYRGGYPLLLAPAWLFTDDPATVYRLAQAENATISALMLPLAYLLVRRCGLTRSTSFLIGNAAAFVPSAVFYSSFVMVDAILPVLVTAWLLLAHSWLTETDRRRAAFLGLAASALAGWSTPCTRAVR
jgi:hypothetical protein